MSLSNCTCARQVILPVAPWWHMSLWARTGHDGRREHYVLDRAVRGGARFQHVGGALHGGANHFCLVDVPDDEGRCNMLHVCAPLHGCVPCLGVEQIKLHLRVWRHRSTAGPSNHRRCDGARTSSSSCLAPGQMAFSDATFLAFLVLRVVPRTLRTHGDGLKLAHKRITRPGVQSTGATHR